MFKAEVEPQATGKWLHCKVLNLEVHALEDENG